MKSTNDKPAPLDLEEVKWQQVERALRMADNRLPKAAELLGISRVTLWRWLKTREAA